MKNERLEEIVGREFDILAVNSPATTQNKVELPGEPVLMQYALSLMINNINSAKESMLEGAEDSDYPCFPRVSDYDPETGEFGKSDFLLYDPRIWDESAREEFQSRLDSHGYKVALFTTLSQSHPFAIEMARMVKEKDPNTIVVFGGSHQSETIKHKGNGASQKNGLSLPLVDNLPVKEHNTLSQIAGGKVDDVVDFVVGGQGEHSVDYLMKSIGQIIDSGEELTPESLKRKLTKDRGTIKDLDGDFTIAYIEDGKIESHRSSGRKTSVLEMPDHTDIFTIHTRNRTIDFYENGWNRERDLREDDEGDLTTHLISNDKCVMRCNFCSESADGNPPEREGFDPRSLLSSLEKKVGRELTKKLTGDIDTYGIPEMFYLRTLNAIANGAGSLFDDTSIHFSGDLGDMERYASLLTDAKKQVAASEGDFSDMLGSFHYAYQLTVERALEIEREKPDLIKQILEAGGKYVYIGLESMSDEVLKNIHKYAVIEDPRFENKSDAIEHALEFIKSQRYDERAPAVGTSVLFGLRGETSETIDCTIDRVRDLMDRGLIDFASPNVYTFHPRSPLGREFERKYGFEPDYTVIPEVDRVFRHFEEASPRNSSPLVSDSNLLRIVERTENEWEKINHQEIA